LDFFIGTFDILLAQEKKFTLAAPSLPAFFAGGDGWGEEVVAVALINNFSCTDENFLIACPA